MKVVVSFLILVGISLSCEKSYLDDVDILGKWLLLGSCDSCATFEFEKNNNLTIHEIGNEHSNTYDYKLFRDNTIQIDYGTTKGRYDIINQSIDTIEIVGFSISGIPEEMNTLLKRLH